MKLRTTYDPTVVDAWSLKLAERKKGGRVIVAMFVAVAAAFGIFLLTPGDITLVCLVAAGLGLLGATLADRRPAVVCPLCGRSPIKWYDRSRPQFAASCAHCNYWLRSPYESDDSRGHNLTEGQRQEPALPQPGAHSQVKPVDLTERGKGGATETGS